MENHPPIRRRDEDLDGSTIRRESARLDASLGSTASLKTGSTPGAFDPATLLDDAVTVVRKTDSVGGGPVAPTGYASTPAGVASVLLGTHLNHFLLEELIGGGGMGAVFRARDERLDRIVAIKVIPFVGDDVDLQRRFRNEAQNAARLDHPYIARVFDVGQFEQWHYIVFEYVEGINIRDMIARDGVLSIDDAVYYTREIAEAIEHAIGRGIVHRDVKPSNVLVGVDGNVKVVDMGLARSQQIDVSGDMTASGVTLGTFDYISPEQARDPRDADVRSDIYSLGCTLYYMLTGSPPYPGGTMLQKLLSHGNSPPPDPRELRPEVSENLTAIIHKMLAKDPQARYQRAIDLVADLRELAIREGLTRAQTRGTLTITAADPIPQFLTRHLPWMVGVMMLLAGAAWLQISSSVTRDNFAIPAPPLDGSVVSSETQADPTIQPTEAIGLRNNAAPLPIDVAAVPPKFDSIAMQSSGQAISPRPLAPTAATVPLVSSIKAVRIVVGDVTSDPSARLASTLVEAIRLAEELKVDEIEIAKKSIVSAPIQILRDGLTIRSSVGKSEIRFIDGEFLTMQRIAMIDVGTQRLDLQDVHLSWNARNARIEGGSMFRIASNNRRVRLQNCTLTIENLADRDEIFAFEIRDLEGKLPSFAPPPAAPAPNTLSAGQTAAGKTSAGTASAGTTSAGTTSGGTASGGTASGGRTAGATPSENIVTGVTITPDIAPVTEAMSVDDRMLGKKSQTPSLVAIELKNVAARGEMTLVNLVDPIQLQFQWTNGLLAISRRMLEATGTSLRTPIAGDQIQILLDQVTVWAPDGLVRTALGPSGLNPMMVDRNSRRSVFHHSSAANHVSFEGLESDLIDPSLIIQLRGEDNAYDLEATRDACILFLSQWNGPSRSVRVADILAPEKSSWFPDRSPQWVVRWSRPVPITRPSRLRIADFSQEGTVVAGFDAATLPDFPVRNIPETEI